MFKTTFLSYKDAGVDIDHANEIISQIKTKAQETYHSNVISGIGGFSAIYNLPEEYKNPVLISNTDGIGTKLFLALDYEAYSNIGVDLVAMCINDLATYGAKPLFFLDYYATSKISKKIIIGVISGIIEGCKQSKCSFIGGETAEMPGIYSSKTGCDIAGFCVGILERSEIIDGSKIAENDILLAISSNGLHANGYSLVRKIIKNNNICPSNLRIDKQFLKEHLLVPTKIYINSILNLKKYIKIHAISHITGGGLQDNISRIIPQGMHAVIYRNSWKLPAIFKWIQQTGKVNEYDMLRTFNCGVGMVLFINKNDTKKSMQILSDYGEQPWIIGHIEKSSSSKRLLFI